jgi:GT2 family glycosyltransferase
MITVIIPTYKNKELLLNNLKHNLLFLNGCETIIINDNPDESLKSELKAFNQIILIENQQHLGFGPSINKGVAIAKNRYLMLLNSDVLINDEQYKKVIKEFEKNPKLFAVSFAQLEKNNTTVGKNTIFWQKGFMQHGRSNNLNKGINAWAEGGSCIIDKEKFVLLGGFDPIYSPFYWEDIDISYRAWKQNYEIIFDPNIKVVHHHESTIGKFFNKKQIFEIAFRNQLIFIWKNIEDRRLSINHWRYLLPTIILPIFKGNLSYVKGFFNALTSYCCIKKNNENTKINDWLVLQKFHE